MRHCCYKLARTIARQLGIGIERDDVTNPYKNRDVAHQQRKAPFPLSSQQGIQVSKSAAFAFITHPALFNRIPAPWPVKQEKSITAAFRCITYGIFLIESFN